MSTPGIPAVGANRATAPTAAPEKMFGTPPFSSAYPYGRAPVSGAPYTPVVTTDADLAAAIDQYIAQTFPNSPMKGQGANFVKYGRANNIDPSLLAAIARNESGFGTAGVATNGSRNAFGLGGQGHFMTFPTWQAGISAAAAAIKGYNAKDINAIAQRYDPGEKDKWAAAVTSFYNSLPHGVTPVTGSDKAPSGATVATGVGPSIQDAISGPLHAIEQFLSWITDPSKWLRIGEMALGVLGLAGAVFGFVKGRTVFAVILGMAGYLFLYSGIKNISPVKEFQDAFKP